MSDLHQEEVELDSAVMESHFQKQLTQKQAQQVCLWMTYKSNFVPRGLQTALTQTYC